MYNHKRGDTMTDNEIYFAAKLYQKNQKDRNYSYEDFLADIAEHKRRSPSDFSSPHPVAMGAELERLWKILNMTMREVVDYSGMNMSKFSKRFCIPYRTLQAWCDGTNPCPVYVKLMLCELLGIMPTRVQFISMTDRQSVSAESEQSISSAKVQVISVV